jgi:hypothetical protein
MPVLIGIGSFLFHSFATVWGFWADVLPIALFQLLAMNFAFSRLFKFSNPTSLCLLVLFVASSSFLGHKSLQGVLSGSLTCLPSLIFMIALYLKSRKTSNRDLIVTSLSSLLVFLCALCFRSLDLYICSIFPMGNHFVWPLLSGVLFFLCIRYALYLDGSRTVNNSPYTGI